MENVVQKSQKQETVAKTPKLKMAEKLSFGVGDFGANFSWTFISAFVTIYLTDTVGMAAGTIGTIIFIVRIFDGTTDLFMGNIIDNTNSKMGKARPWIFWTAPPLALLTFMLFNVPSFLGGTGQIVYVFIIYLLISAVFYTANNVAYSSLTSFMTNDPKDRVSLGSNRFIFGVSGTLLITSFTTILVAAFGGGQKGWTYTALIAALLCAIPLMITGYFVKERNVAKKAQEIQKTSLLPVIKVLFTNKYFIWAIFLYIFTYFSNISDAAQIYYATYIFGNANLMGILSIASLLPLVIGLFFAPRIAGRFGLRNSVLLGVFAMLIGIIISWIFSENLTGMIVGLIIKSFGTVPLLAGASAIVADVGDLVYWKSGQPVQGAVFSITSAGMKIGQGFASALVGWVLALGTYVPNAVIQSSSVIFSMKALYIYIPFIITILLAIVVSQFKYEKHMPKVRKEISLGNVGENHIAIEED